MRNFYMQPYATARLLIVGFLGLVACTEARNIGSHVDRQAKSWDDMEHSGRLTIEKNRMRRRLEGSRSGKGSGKGGGKDDGKVDSRAGTKGGSGGGSASAGGSAISSNAWVNGEYYGCLGLSQDERAQMRSAGGSLDCDYTKHDVVDLSQGTAASNSSNSNGQQGSNSNTNSSSSASSNNRSGIRTGRSQSTSSQVVSNISDSTDPYNAFNIQQCDSYEHLWTWDLQMSCGTTSNYDECHCTFAETLMEKGLLSCDDAKNCPKGCTICSSCLRLLGCSSDSVYAGTEDGSAAAAAAAVFTLFVGTGFCLFFDRRRKRRRGKLNDHLMDEENSEESQGRIWMVPLDSGVPTEQGSCMKPVWLAPADTIASTDDSSLASTNLDSEEERSTQVKEEGVESSTLRQKQWLDQSRWDKDLFPDVLAHEHDPQQPRRVPTVPTDKTSDSDHSPVHNALRNESDDKSELQDSVNSSSQSIDSESTMTSVPASPFVTRPAVKALRSILMPEFHDNASEYTSESNSSTLTNSLECEVDSI